MSESLQHGCNGESSGLVFGHLDIEEVTDEYTETHIARATKERERLERSEEAEAQRASLSVSSKLVTQVTTTAQMSVVPRAVQTTANTGQRMTLSIRPSPAPQPHPQR
ncbi:Fc.00g083100.m01.CDS01 [Cosmosporella sp. VM-42]